MDAKVIKISVLLGKEIRSRANAEQVRLHLGDATTLDFSDVEFISRSFADELYNLKQETPNLDFTGMSGDVFLMYEAVVKGRNSVRIYKKDNSTTFTAHSLEELSKALAF